MLIDALFVILIVTAAVIVLYFGNAALKKVNQAERCQRLLTTTYSIALSLLDSDQQVGNEKKTAYQNLMSDALISVNNGNLTENEVDNIKFWAENMYKK